METFDGGDKIRGCSTITENLLKVIPYGLRQYLAVSP